jgi:phosphate:Na+ symporter
MTLRISTRALRRRPSLALVPVVALIAMLAGPALGAGGDLADAPRWLAMITTGLGGLALFLFGMEQMSDGLKAAAGDQMRVLLSKVTANRVVGAATGAFVTAIIQSSSVTTVLVVGFISAGLMSMAQSVPVIMGANIGTTITAQIVAFKVTEIALPMIAVGFAMLFLGKRDRVRHYGAMLMGLGLVFFGMTIMGDAMAPLREYPPFLELMRAIEAPLLGILVGAVFTALVQSSSATTGIVIVMATQGLISLPAGIAVAIGANIGTCVTALLATLGKSREAVRAAGVHVFFNVAGALLWVGLIGYLAEIAVWISPASAAGASAQALAVDTPRQIANANTLFNVINALLFLPFTAQIARLIERLIPERAVPEAVIVEPKFLDEELVETPSLALDRVRLELGHMGERVTAMLAAIRPAFADRDRERLKEIRKQDDAVDILRDRIIEYLGLIGREPLTDSESEALVKAMTATDDLERIGDLIETDLVDTGYAAIEQNLHPSETTQLILRQLFDVTSRSVALAVQAITEQDERAAQEVIAAKAEVRQLVEAALKHQAMRLSADAAERLAHHRIEISLIDKLKRVHSLARHIAKLSLPAPVLADAA